MTLFTRSMYRHSTGTSRAVGPRESGKNKPWGCGVANEVVSINYFAGGWLNVQCRVDDGDDESGR